MASSSSASLCAAVLLLSWAGDMVLGQGGGGGGGGGGTSSLPCVTKLLPCQKYLQSPEKPPATCCGPLAEALQTEKDCLCKVFNNEALLKSFNVTKEQAMHLPQACGAKADSSLCAPTGNGTSSGAPPSTSPGSSSGTPSAPSSGKGNSTSSAFAINSQWSSVLVLAATWMSFLIVLQA